MPDLKTLGAVIGWVGGALAGITALLYAIGFIATLYHLNLMGINTELVTRDGFVYVGRGAVALNRAFLFIFLGAVMAGAVVWLVDHGIALFASALSAVRQMLFKKTFSVGAFGTAAVLLVVAVGLLVFALQAYVHPPAAGVGLLFQDRICADGGVRLVCDTKAADETFGFASIFAGAILIVSWVGATRIPGDGLARRALFVGYSATALFVVFFLVPVAYGLLVMREDMPRVTLMPADAARLNINGSTLQLLRQDSSGDLLWLRETREMVWVAPGELKSLRIGHGGLAVQPAAISSVPPGAKP